ncbi:MAG: NupC/NupG family nucleoside CNT transporter [Planctomycetota bacterium]|nr:MAG: NupC/NupG family nucleoside CNT transporter [Planctomycetota bacterium]
MHQIIAGLGYFVMIFLAWLMSSHKSRLPWRVIIGGSLLQLLFASVLLHTKPGLETFRLMGDCFTQLLSFVDAGCIMVFGKDFREHFIAFRVLPTIIFFSALMSVLYHLGIMQVLVKVLGRVMQLTLGTSGAESLSAAANIFVGQTEAPLVVRPYLAKMTKSELMAIMVGGFATIAGGVMAAYVEMDISAAHLLTASVISAPAGLLIAKVLQPEVETPATTGTENYQMQAETGNLIEAAASGTSEGLHLALNVGAMLIAFLSLIAMVDYGLEHLSAWLMAKAGIAGPPLTLTRVLGALFAPLAWLMGIEWKECAASGELLGLKLVATEFVAYDRMSMWMKAAPDLRPLSERSVVIMTYALCGFSNFASIGIQIGGIGALAPERRRELSQIALRAMLGGALACCMTGCIAGILWQPASPESSAVPVPAAVDPK